MLDEPLHFSSGNRQGDVSRSRLLVSEIVGRLELFGFLIELVLILQGSPRMRRLAGILLIVLFDRANDFLVGRHVLLRPVNPASVQDVAEVSGYP